jgi:ell wall binding domain 2 (CWB2)
MNTTRPLGPATRHRRRSTRRKHLGVSALALTALATSIVAPSSASAAPAFNYSLSSSWIRNDNAGRPIMTVLVKGSADIPVTSPRITIAQSLVNPEATYTLTEPGTSTDSCAVDALGLTCTISMARLGDGTYVWSGNFTATGTRPGNWVQMRSFMISSPLSPLDAVEVDNQAVAAGYQRLGTPLFKRMAGADRIETALAIANDGNPTVSLNAVVLARSDLFPDALAGGPLAAARRAPLLFTPPTALDTRVEQFLRDRLPAGGTVFLLGDAEALSMNVESRLIALGFNITRLGGATRFDTALSIFQAATAGVSKVHQLYLADGRTFPDAVCAGAAASASTGRNRGLLLVDGTTIPAPVLREINTVRPTELVVMGGIDTARVDSSISVVRISGADAVARCASPMFDEYAAKPRNRPLSLVSDLGIGLVSADAFPDGLAAAAHASSRNLRVLLTPGTSLAPAVRDAMTRFPMIRNADRRYDNTIYGGPAAISDNVARSLG